MRGEWLCKLRQEEEDGKGEMSARFSRSSSPGAAGEVFAWVSALNGGCLGGFEASESPAVVKELRAVPGQNA